MKTILTILACVPFTIAIGMMMFWSSVCDAAIHRIEKKIPDGVKFNHYTMHFSPFNSLRIAEKYDPENAAILKKGTMWGQISVVLLIATFAGGALLLILITKI